jgi:gamma-glutamylaminecyclotransferase
MLLFVYGTLKRGGKNVRLMSSARFLQEVSTVPRYQLYSLGPHPALIRDEQTGRSIHGELWDIPEGCALDELDDFEGVPTWFDRQPIQLSDSTISAQAYFYAQTLPADAVLIDVW